MKHQVAGRRGCGLRGLDARAAAGTRAVSSDGTREIAPEDFCSSILSTEVRVVAITNHNVFDLAQFEDIRTRIGTDAQVWPGVELDVHDEKTKGHLLVITSPELATQFSAAVIELRPSRSRMLPHWHVSSQHGPRA
jgi:predicted metal-dependent phosphoesterase TrpH